MRILDHTSRSLSEYLLIPDLTTSDCTPDQIDLTTPLVRHRVGAPSPITLTVPLVGAIMGAVSSVEMSVAIGRSGGLGFLHHNQPITDQARMVNEVRDHESRPVVGAGINTHDYVDRVPALIGAGVDVLCLDSSDGFSVWQRDVLTHVHGLDPTLPVGAGNVVDARGFRYLAEAGAAFVKVGIGGGSICTTREQKGIGRGQASALIDVVAERDRYADETGDYVPVCCDGGVLADSHMAIALALGADMIMLGRYFARFDESPAPLGRVNGQLVKEYWGEGSQRARNWSRYEQGVADLVFEEGVDGYVPYAGSLPDAMATTATKLRATLSSCGANRLRDFHERAVLTTVSGDSQQQNSHQVTLRDVAAV